MKPAYTENPVSTHNWKLLCTPHNFFQSKNVSMHQFPRVHREFSVLTSVHHLQPCFDWLKVSCVPIGFSVLTQGIFV